MPDHPLELADVIKHVRAAYDHLAPKFGASGVQDYPRVEWRRDFWGAHPVENLVCANLAINKQQENATSDERYALTMGVSVGMLLHRKVNPAIQREHFDLIEDVIAQLEADGRDPSNIEVYSNPQILRASNLMWLVSGLAGFSYLSEVWCEPFTNMPPYDYDDHIPSQRAGYRVASNLFHIFGDNLLRPLALAPTWSAAERIYLQHYDWRPDFEKMGEERNG